MNRLVILGNGFDLAHGLPTRYEDFMLHYLKDVFKKREDALGLIDFQNTLYVRADLEAEVDTCKSVKELFTYLDKHRNVFQYSIESQLLNELLNSLNDYNWVDVEGIYYSLLVKSIAYPSYHVVSDINRDFEILKNLLEKYLFEEVEQKYELKASKEFLNIFLTKSSRVKKSSAFSIPNKYPEKTVFLNFNYTTLIEDYLIEPEIIHHLGNPEVNYIHGELNNDENPIIFGFGDEVDKSYQEIEELNNNEYFEHIKSFQYSKTSNYQNLIRFLDGSIEGYEIFIVGHSCGLSDRTLLNHVFEHENCDSIKIYYHKDLKGYTNTVHEISRHFKNKAQMRTKIVPFDKSIPTPQVQLNKIK